jgi:hypothetical protein
MSETPKLLYRLQYHITTTFSFVLLCCLGLLRRFSPCSLGPKYHSVDFLTWMVGMMAAVCGMLENICNQQCGYSKRVVVTGWGLGGSLTTHYDKCHIAIFSYRA